MTESPQPDPSQPQPDPSQPQPTEPQPDPSQPDGGEQQSGRSGVAMTADEIARSNAADVERTTKEAEGNA